MTKLTFLGTGTSQGIPVISCGCRVCTSPDIRDKRLRTAALVETEGLRLVIDAGPDFRQQMLSGNVTHVDGILITHGHKDHIGGLDDVRAFNHTSGAPVDIYAEKRVQKVIRKDFDYAFAEHKYPGAPDIRLHTIDEQPFRIKNVEVVPVRGHHYKLPVLGFRIGALAYLTDFNRIEPAEIEKIKGVDILVVNALRKEHHLSHFTLDEAIGLGRQVGARRICLTHLSHQMGRHSEEEPFLPSGFCLARDGQTIETEL